MNDPYQPDLIVFDCYSVLFRAFHAFPETLTSSTGEATNGVYGFTKMVLDVLAEIRPEYVIATVDMGKPTFRHEAFVEYKANRDEAPASLKDQIPFMHEVLAALAIPTLGVEGYEADDVIGTIVTQFAQQNPDVSIGIFTGDKDAYQLVTEQVSVLRPGRKPKESWRVVDREGVIDGLGVTPEQVPDYKALCGDASDNIPGVRGIGPKTAQKLLAAAQTLENLYTVLEDTSKPFPWDISSAIQQKLLDGKRDAFMSQQLATIDRNVPISCTLEQAKLSDYDKAEAHAVFEKFAFRSLIKRLPADDFEQGVQSSLF
jgi:DNA polymerase-1